MYVTSLAGKHLKVCQMAKQMTETWSLYVRLVFQGTRQLKWCI